MNPGPTEYQSMRNPYILVTAVLGAVGIAAAIVAAASAADYPPPVAPGPAVYRIDVVKAAAGEMVWGSPAYTAVRDGKRYFFADTDGPAKYLEHPEWYPDVYEVGQLAAHK